MLLLNKEYIDVVIVAIYQAIVSLFNSGRLRGSAEGGVCGAAGARHAEPGLRAERERPPHRVQAPHRKGRGKSRGDCFKITKISTSLYITQLLNENES